MAGQGNRPRVCVWVGAVWRVWCCVRRRCREHLSSHSGGGRAGVAPSGDQRGAPKLKGFSGLRGLSPARYQWDQNAQGTTGPAPRLMGPVSLSAPAAGPRGRCWAWARLSADPAGLRDEQRARQAGSRASVRKAVICLLSPELNQHQAAEMGSLRDQSLPDSGTCYSLEFLSRIRKEHAFGGLGFSPLSRSDSAA